MDCKDVRKLLPAVVDEALDPADRERVNSHISSCPDCRKALAELQQTVGLVRNLDEVEPPAWLTQKIMSRIKAEQPAKDGLWKRLFGWPPAGVPAAALATVVVAIAAVIIMKSMEPAIHEMKIESQAPSATRNQSTESGIKPQESKESKEISVRSEEEGVRGEEPKKKTAVQHDLQSAARAEDARGEVSKIGPAEQLDMPKARLTEQPTVSNLPSPAAPPAGDAMLKGRGDAAASKKDSPQQGIPAESASADRQNAAPARRPELPRQQSAPAVPAAPMAAGGSLGKAKEEKVAVLERQPYERVITERHSDGSPMVVTTTVTTPSGTKKIMEERFDGSGRRHGMHISYYEDGRPAAEVMYEHGQVVAVREFDISGRPRRADHEPKWPWLR